MKSYSGKIAGMALAAVLAGALPLLGQTAPEQSAPPGEGRMLFIRRAGPGPGGQVEGGADVVWYANEAAPVTGPAGEPMPPPIGPMGGPMGPMGAMGPHMGPMISFVSAVGGFGGNTVTGSPYSAEAVTEIEQRLADGNRIARRTTATIYRDSEGRTRRDQTLGAIGPWVVGGELPQISSIYDPVEKVRYMLDHTHRTARKLPVPAMPTFARAADGQDQTVALPPPVPPPGAATGVMAAGEPFEIPLPPPPGIGFRAEIAGPASLPEPRTESLGTQLMEGVEAAGTRSISTIPAGAIGNDFAIEIVSERWYSPELQAVVLSLHKDPRMGETTYRLNNIQRTEPSRSLFEVPEGYTVIEPEIRAFPPPPAP